MSSRPLVLRLTLVLPLLLTSGGPGVTPGPVFDPTDMAPYLDDHVAFDPPLRLTYRRAIAGDRDRDPTCDGHGSRLRYGVHGRPWDVVEAIEIERTPAEGIAFAGTLDLTDAFALVPPDASSCTSPGPGEEPALDDPPRVLEGGHGGLARPGPP